MKLTNTMRDAFVRSVINEVPRIDYQAQLERVIRDDEFEQAPPVIQAVLKSEHFYALDRNSVHYFKKESGASISFHSHGLGAVNMLRHHVLTEEAVKKIREIAELARVQKEKLEELKTAVTAAIYGFTTVEKARQGLPEFAKFLPTEAPVTKNPVAVINPISKLLDAGWPKNKVMMAETAVAA